MLFLHPQEKQPFITVIKDVITGTIVGVFVLLLLSFLDYRNVIPLRSARGLRQTAIALIADPETAQSIEESMDMKYIRMEIFNEITEEISRHEIAIADMNKGLSMYEEELEEKKKAIEPFKKEHGETEARLRSMSGLDKWCGSCAGGWGNCDVRVKFLFQTYHTPEIVAKVDIMKKGRCLKG